jgi:hypothetical protein
MYSDKVKSFAKFLALAKQFQAAGLYNFCKIAYYKATSYFQAAFFALSSMQHAARMLYTIIGINSTYIGSKFQMTLLIAVGISAY